MDTEDKVVYRYNAKASGAIPGVPRRDLMEADLATLPAWVKASVAQSQIYTAVEDPEVMEAVTQLSGIGHVTKQKFLDAGIVTLEDVLATDDEVLAELLPGGIEVADVKQEAKEMTNG